MAEPPISDLEYANFGDIENRINDGWRFKNAIPIPVLRQGIGGPDVDLQFFNWANTAALTALRNTVMGFADLFLAGTRVSTRRKRASKLLAGAFDKFIKTQSREASSGVAGRLILCLDDFVTHASPHLGADDRYVIVGRVAEIAEAQPPSHGEISERMKKKIMRLRLEA